LLWLSHANIAPLYALAASSAYINLRRKCTLAAEETGPLVPLGLGHLVLFDGCQMPNVEDRLQALEGRRGGGSTWLDGGPPHACGPGG